MCGIFGLLNNINGYISKDDVLFMSNHGQSRGPECSTVYNNDNENVVLGFHRLAINGLDNGSNQPLEFNKCQLICNGEIYNYKELYEKLGITSQSNSDCEIILHLYYKFGIEIALQMLDGVFAFILFDETNGKIFVGRDPYGVRPLFMCNDTTNNIFGFSSELKQLHPMNIIFDNVKFTQVEPGSYKEFELVDDKFYLKDTKKYSTFGFDKMKLYSPDNWNIYFEIIQDKFENAVKKRVENTERPIACLLSGGLDSSLVTSIVKKHYTGQLETYSIGLEGAEDLKFAKQVADYLQTKHTEVIVSEDDFFNAIPEVIKKIESYDTTTVRASVGNYLIGKYISEHSEAKVIFNGDGSDELMGGYLYMHYAPNAMEFDLECKRLLKDISYFDVLRSDRSISTHGLEPRTPFLDRGWVEAYLSIPEEVRFHKLYNLPEKYLIRKSFSLGGYLPENVLWRTKEAFSDGVSNINRSWYTIIDEKLQPIKSLIMDNDNGSGKTLEQCYYKQIFDEHYCGCDDIIPYYWMPRFVDAKDASARTLKIYSETINI